MTRDYAKQKSPVRHGYSSSMRIPSPWTILTAGLVLGVFIASLFYLQLNFLQHSDEDDEQESLAQIDSLAEESAVSDPKVETKGPKVKKEVTKVTSVAQAEVKKQPRFDFYTILPSMDADAPEEMQVASQLASQNEQAKEQAVEVIASAQDNNVVHAPTLSPDELTKVETAVEPVTQNTPTTVAQAESLPKRVHETSEQAFAYMVQAGSFKDFEEADTLKALLALQGFDSPHIQSIKTQEGDARYRVFLGPYGKEEDANSQKAMLSQYNIKDSLILKSEVTNKP